MQGEGKEKCDRTFECRKQCPHKGGGVGFFLLLCFFFLQGFCQEKQGHSCFNVVIFAPRLGVKGAAELTPLVALVVLFFLSRSIERSSLNSGTEKKERKEKIPNLNTESQVATSA